MNTQKPTQIEINLGHRFNYASQQTALTQGQLIQSIESITDRAIAAVSVLQTLCTADGGAPLAEINPELVYFSLESVRLDIKDLAAIAAAIQRAGGAA